MVVGVAFNLCARGQVQIMFKFIMESAGKRRRSMARSGGHSGLENSLINDFLDLRDSDMVQTGPKRPRGGEKEMWLTPDPLTPLENLSRRRRSSKPSTRKLSLVRSASKSVKKKAAAESTSAVAGDESPRAESVSRADNQASPAGLTLPLSNTTTLNITPNIRDHSPHTASPTTEHSDGSSSTPDKSALSDQHHHENQAHQTPPQVQGHDIIPPQSPNQSQTHKSTEENLPPRAGEQYVGETPEPTSKVATSPRTSTGTRRLRSVLKDIRTLSSLRRQANRNTRVSFGRFITVAEFSPDVSTSQSLSGEKLMKENVLVQSSPSNENPLAKSSPLLNENTLDEGIPAEESFTDENLVTENSPILDRNAPDRSPLEDSSTNENSLEETSPHLDDERGSDSSPPRESLTSTSEKVIEESSPALDSDKLPDTESEAGVEVEGSPAAGDDRDTRMDNGTDSDGGSGIEFEGPHSRTEGSDNVGDAETGASSASPEGPEAVELEPLSDGEEGAGEEEEEGGEVEGQPEVAIGESSKSRGRQRRKTSFVTKSAKKKVTSSLARSLVRNLFMLSSKKRVTKDAMDLIVKFSDVYLKQLSGDLSAYTRHAGRRTIEVEDTVLLLRRQRIVSEKKPFEYLVNRHLPLEYLEELLPCALAGKDVYP